MQFTDRASVGKTHRTNDGYLAAEVRTARTGIQLYSGSEMGLMDTELVRVYRPAESVFDKASLASYASKPVTDDHPSEMVDSNNWTDLAKGFVGNEVARDGEFVRIPLIVTDARTIKQIEDGKKELSAGYISDVEFTPGEVEIDGKTVAYDAIQRNIRINHVAVVDKARGGKELRIGDNSQAWGAFPVNLKTHDNKGNPMDVKTRKVSFDGLTIECTDQGAQVIEKLSKQLADSTAKFDAADAAHKEAIAAKDKELGQKDAKIAELESAKVSDADLDSMVADRAALVGSAAKLVENFDAKGKTNADIRREVVSAKVGDAAVADKSDEYVEARFDALVSTISNDAVASAVAQGELTASAEPMAAMDKALSEMHSGLQNAWKGAE